MAIGRAAQFRPGRRLMIGLLAAIVIVVAGVTAFSIFEARDDRPPVRKTLPLGGPSISGQGSLVEPPGALSDFSLTSQTGEPVSLSSLRGRVVLLFFGFTNCPDICPLTLGEFKNTKRLLGADADRTAFVFISVDSERDNVAALRTYIGAFDATFIGLQGEPAILDRIAPEYDLVYRKQELGGSGGYSMAHTASAFLIDPAGRLRVVFPYGIPAEALAKDVRTFLAQP